MTGGDLAAAAAALTGIRFRLNGRDPADGLDCIGVLDAAMRRAGRPLALPRGYSLRTTAPEPWLPDAGACGFDAADLPYRPGDVVLIRPAPAQLHLAIAVDRGGWVHAHAGLRRVVLSPERPAGTILHHWRLRPPN